MPIVRRGDLSIYWAERGTASLERPPVVLLHGLTLSTRMFERLARDLSPRWVVLVDLHGHGRSSRPTEEERYTWTDLAADVIAVLDALDVDQAVVGGLSLGANVTLTVAIEHADRCAGLIVEMPALDKSWPTARRLFLPLAKGFSAGAPVLTPVSKAVGHMPVPRRPFELAAARAVLANDPRVNAAVMRGVVAAGPPDTSTLVDVEAPTLVIGHRHDRLHALADARRVAATIPGAELVVARSIAHYRVRPKALATLVRSFLDRHGI